MTLEFAHGAHGRRRASPSSAAAGRRAARAFAAGTGSRTPGRRRPCRTARTAGRGGSRARAARAASTNAAETPSGTSTPSPTWRELPAYCSTASSRPIATIRSRPSARATVVGAVAVEPAGVVDEHRRAGRRARAEVHGVAVEVRVDQLGVDPRGVGHAGEVGGERDALARAARALRRGVAIVVTGHRVGQHDAIADHRDVGHALPAVRVVGDARASSPAASASSPSSVAVVGGLGAAVREHVRHHRAQRAVARRVTHGPLAANTRPVITSSSRPSTSREPAGRIAPSPSTSSAS